MSYENGGQDTVIDLSAFGATPEVDTITVVGVTSLTDADFLV